MLMVLMSWGEKRDEYGEWEVTERKGTNASN